MSKPRITMKQVKQKTVGKGEAKTTLKLVRLDNDLPENAIGFSGKYKYEIRNSFGGVLGTYNTLADAKDAFNEEIESRQTNLSML